MDGGSKIEWGRVILVFLALLAVAAGLWVAFRRQKTPDEVLDAFGKEMEPKGGRLFRAELRDRKLAFLMLDCKVYLLTVANGKVKQEKVLRTGFYFGLTVCTGQSMRMESGFVIAELSNRAIGAGGGNTSGGTYRSTDGVQWEKNTNKGWRNVDDAQV